MPQTVESLYNLSFRFIVSDEGNKIKFFLKQLPKSIHRDINTEATKSNYSYYFALTRYQFNTFVDLLLSNCLNENFLCSYLRHNKRFISYISFWYYKRRLTDANLGLTLGNILKRAGKLEESELILSSHLKEPLIVSAHFLKEILHLRCLQGNYNMHTIFGHLKERLKSKQVVQELANVYNGLALFVLFVRYYPIDEAKYWNDRALEVRSNNELLTNREHVEILLTTIKIMRLGKNNNNIFQKVEYFYEAINRLKFLHESQDSLAQLYTAKVMKELLLNFKKARKNKSSHITVFRKLIHFMVEIFPYLDNPSSLSRYRGFQFKYLVRNVKSIYKYTLGANHTSSKKVRQELNLTINKKLKYRNRISAISWAANFYNHFFIL